MYWANKEAADAAKSAAQIAKDTSIASNRPWVTAQVTIDGDLFFTADGDPHLPIRYKLSNVGHSPAIDVWSDQNLFMAVNIQRDTQAERDRLCGETEKRSVNMGPTIFPGSDFTGSMTTSASKENIRQSFSAKGASYLTPHISVCVAYRSTLDSAKWLHTGMILTLKRIDDRGLEYAITPGLKVPQDHLILHTSFFRGIVLSRHCGKLKCAARISQTNSSAAKPAYLPGPNPGSVCELGKSLPK